jgi:Lon protease-like protein
MTMRTLPLFPLSTVLFPGMALPLLISEERYKVMFERCMAQDRRFGVALISSGQEVGGPAVPHPVGTVARIVSWEHLNDRRIKVMTVGENRFRIVETLEIGQPYLAAAIQLWEDESSESGDMPRLMRDLSDNFLDYLTLIMLLSGYALPVAQFDLSTNPTILSYHVATSLQVDLPEKQCLLEEPSAPERLRRELILVRRERDFLQRLVSLRGVAGELDTRWGPKIYRESGSGINWLDRKGGSSGG